MRHIALIVILAIFPCTSQAKIDCENPASTPEINECAQKELNVVEKNLNTTYRRVIKSLDRPEDGMNYNEIKKSLVEAQRAWVVFREKDCGAYHALHASGTIRTVMYIGCMKNHAERRIKEIEEYEM